MVTTLADIPAGRINVALPTEAVPELVLDDVLRDGPEWMPFGGEHIRMRLLMANVVQGSWVSLLRASGPGVVSRHRHPAPVTAMTLEGAWHYLEHDWVARPGTFIFEPAGDTHTLMCHPSEGHFTALFHSFGPLIYVDETGQTLDYEDVFKRLDTYKAHCLSVGIALEDVLKLVR